MVRRCCSQYDWPWRYVIDMIHNISWLTWDTGFGYRFNALPVEGVEPSELYNVMHSLYHGAAVGKSNPMMFARFVMPELRYIVRLLRPSSSSLSMLIVPAFSPPRKTGSLKQAWQLGAASPSNSSKNANEQCSNLALEINKNWKG